MRLMRGAAMVRGAGRCVSLLEHAAIESIFGNRCGLKKRDVALSGSEVQCVLERCNGAWGVKTLSLQTDICTASSTFCGFHFILDRARPGGWLYRVDRCSGVWGLKLLNLKIECGGRTMCNGRVWVN